MPCWDEPQSDRAEEERETVRLRIVAYADQRNLWGLLEERLLRPLGIQSIACAGPEQLAAIEDRMRWVDLY